MNYEYHPKNSLLFRQGDSGNKVYFILSGSLHSYVNLSPEEIEQEKARKAYEENTSSKTETPHGNFLLTQPPTKTKNTPHHLRPSKQNAHIPTVAEGDSEIYPSLSQNEEACSGTAIPKSASSRQSLESAEALTSIEGQSLTSAQRRTIKRPLNLLRAKVLQLRTKRDDNSEHEKNEKEVGSSAKRGNKSLSSAPKLRVSTFKEEPKIESFNSVVDNDGSEVVKDMKFFGVIGPGNICGELALITGRKRMATIIAGEDCHLAVLSCEDFKRLILPLDRGKFKKRVQFFENVFGPMVSYEQTIKMSYMFSKKKAIRDQMIFIENDKVDGFYIIKSGNILIYKEVENGGKDLEIPEKDKPLEQQMENMNKSPFRVANHAQIKKSQYPIQLLSTNDLLGEETLLDQTVPRPFTAQCKSQTATIYHIPAEKLNTMLWQIQKDSDYFFKRIYKRTAWRAQRLADSQKYIHNVLKASHNLESQLPSNPCFQRVFAKDILSAYAILKDDTRPDQEFKPRPFTATKELPSPYVLAAKTAQKGLRSPGKDSSPNKEQKGEKTPRSFSEFFSVRQRVNNVNMKTLSTHSDEEASPFDLKNNFMSELTEQTAATKKQKAILVARIASRSPARRKTPENSRSSPESSQTYRGAETMRETYRGFGPTLGKVTRASLKLLTKSTIQQEKMRERLAKSLVGGEKKSKREARSNSGIMLLNIKRLDASEEKNTELKNVQNLLLLSTGKCSQNIQERKSNNNSRASPSPERVCDISPSSSLVRIMLAKKELTGMLTTRDLWYERGGLGGASNSSRPMTSVYNTSRKASMKSPLKVVNVLAETSLHSGRKVSVGSPEIRRPIKIVPHSGPVTSRNDEMVKDNLVGMVIHENGIASFRRKGTPERRSRKTADINRKKQNHKVEEERIEGSCAEEDLIERSLADISAENLMRSSKHNMFRVVEKRTQSQDEKELLMRRISL